MYVRNGKVNTMTEIVKPIHAGLTPQPGWYSNTRNEATQADGYISFFFRLDPINSIHLLPPSHNSRCR